jgi:hypothetical protein
MGARELMPMDDISYKQLESSPATATRICFNLTVMVSLVDSVMAVSPNPHDAVTGKAQPVSLQSI